MMTPPVRFKWGSAACDSKKMPLTLTAKDALQIGFGEVHCRSRLNDAGIIHNHIQTTESRERLLNQIMAGSAVGYIDGDARRSFRLGL